MVYGNMAILQRFTWTQSSIFLWICLILSSIVRCQYNANIVQGKQYPEDVLIGRQTLLDNGAQVDTSRASYTVTLLATEGNLANYNTNVGYFMGFQWINVDNPRSKDRINLQLYRNDLNNGSYTLLHESGWIYCEAGLNIYYFNESIPFNTGDFNNSAYVIGFMIPPYSPEPVLHSDGFVEKCSPQMKSNQILRAQLSTQPTVGQSVQFKGSSTPLECPSYYIQGIFLKTHYASKNSGGCSMSVVQNDSSVYLTSQQPFPGSGYASRQSKCQFVRLADPDYYWMKIKPEVFDFPVSEDCIHGGVVIGNQNSLPGDYTQLKKGIYCGNHMFGKAHSRKYLRVDMMPGDNTARHKGYKIRVQADYHDPYNVIMWTSIGSVFMVAIAVLTCICCCFCIMRCKHNRKRLQIPNSGVLISPDGTVRQWDGGHVQQYPVMHNAVNYGSTTQAMYGTAIPPPYITHTTASQVAREDPPSYQEKQPII